MSSIYPKFILEKTENLPLLPEACDKQIKQLFALFKFYVRNGLLATAELEKNQRCKFDPLVRDSLCQRHTIVMFSLIDQVELREQIFDLKKRLQEVANLIDRTMQRPLFMQSDTITLKAIMDAFSIDININKSIRLLFYGHLLTLGSAFRISETGQVEYQTDASRLSQKLSKTLRLDTIHENLGAIRSYFSRKSAKRFVEIVSKITFNLEKNELLLKRIGATHQLLPKDGASPLVATNAFYTMDAALKVIQEKQIPILFKEHRQDKQPLKYLLYGHQEGKLTKISKESTSPETPVLVLKGFIPSDLTIDDLTKRIDALGIDMFIMLNVSLCKQFTAGDHFELLDDAAKKEIEDYRVRASNENILATLKIVHVYPSTIKCEKFS